MNRLIYRLVIISAAYLLITSCVKDVLPTGMRNNATIVPVVKSISTRAGLSGIPHGEPISTRSIAISDSLELIETVYDYNGYLPAASTKGTATTAGNISSFKFDAYAEGPWHDNNIASGTGSESTPYPAGLFFSTTVSGSNGSGWSMSSDQKWLNDVPISFWGSKDAALTLTGATTATFNLTVDGTVTAQIDPVISYNKEKRTFDSSGEISGASSTGNSSNENVNIRFFHALSAVQFMKGDLAGSYRISNITINGVNSKTTCTVTSDPALSPSEGNSNLTFAHSSNTPASFTQDYSAGDASLEKSGTTKYDVSDSKTFFMIPQSLGSGANLTVTFTGSNNSTTSSTFSLSGGEWKDGKYYIYKIGLKGSVLVSIDEVCNDSQKSNVKFHNDSNVGEYIRAAVIANWLDGSGNIVAPWDRSRDGNISLGSGWSESGGFYYHTASVASGGETNALFESFSKPTVPPVPGAHFAMTILVQAVASDSAANCPSAFM